MRQVSRWAPPVAVMAIIFVLSAQPGLDSGLSYDYPLRKAAHMSGFATLWFTLLRALGYRRPLLAAVLSLAYAVSDELHQSTVRDRHGSVVDVVGWDAGGIALGWLAWAWWSGRISPRPTRRSSADHP